ncbi:hypothetical protein [Rugosimonospora africana]|uniref:Uncharacterized protein n=1 Tax=Rugosimonospora africana TaxID=556532 RepID=A0A8J3QZV2_9ACTN|nr:hypothetical protein [Rugosimonospora africana]GIH19237.1 hypothetical protein Raf01_74090 [Rugosimonospora africana]
MRRAGMIPYLAVVAFALASVFGLVSRPATGAPSEHVEHVIVAGTAGLRWDDVDPVDTPNLWRLAQQGSIGALSVRSAHSPTCPPDGWLTLGAGNYAERTDPALQITDECPQTTVSIQQQGRSATLPDQETDVADWNRQLGNHVQPGALADALSCTVAVGQGAAIAAARPYGRVDRYEPTLPSRPGPLLSECPLSIVDLGTLDATDPDARAEQARQVDAHLATVLAGRPKSSLVLVAGLSDTDRSSRLHVAIADGPGYRGGWLTSSSTSRQGYLQLTDLAPTTLNALDRPAPTELFSGQPVDSAPGRPTDVVNAVSHLSDADREADAQRHVAGWFFAILTLFELVLFAGAVPLLRRARRARRLAGRRLRPAPVALVQAAEVLLVAASLAVPGALIADAVPWWRSGAPGLIFAISTLGVVAGLTVLVMLATRGRGTLAPLGAVGGISAGIVGIDVLTGARLQLNGVAGYSAVEGGRYAGLGTIGLGLIIAGILLAAGWLAQRLARKWRPVAVAALGAVGVILVGSPYLGAEAAGAIALTAGVCVAAAICTGGFLTFARLAWATLTGLVVTTGFALLAVHRPAGDRGSLGRFVSAARNGTGGSLVQSTSATNGTSVVTSPLTLVVLGSVILIVFVLLRPTGGLKRLFGIYPAMRAALIGIAVASALAGFLDGVGFNVAGAAAATAVPLATLAALRVLDHADDRTIVVLPLGEQVPAGVRPTLAGVGEPVGVASGVAEPGSAAAGDAPGGSDGGVRPSTHANGDQPGTDTAVNTGQQEPDTPVSAPTAPVGDVLP